MNTEQKNSEKRAVGRPKRYGQNNTFVYGGVRLPISWKNTPIMDQYKNRMNQVIKELCTPTENLLNQNG